MYYYTIIIGCSYHPPPADKVGMKRIVSNFTVHAVNECGKWCECNYLSFNYTIRYDWIIDWCNSNNTVHSMMENPQYPNNPPPSPYHQRNASIPKQPPSHHSDNNDPTTTAELRALDCNLASLCEHVQIEGFNSGSFSDIVVNAMGSTYHLHRLILSRSSYFRSFQFSPL